MNGLKKPQLLALGLAVVVIVLLVLAPRMPSGKQEEMAKMDPAKARTAEAVVLVNGQEPMRGIKMLLEIVKEEPDNVEALWNLGLFSVKSGQYDKALDRFKKVVELDPDGYPDALFYLGRTYATLDSIPQAIASLEKYKSTSQDTAITNGIDRFLLQLKNE
ncbi:MAG: tetratricopeptide repeat protein [Flavobacteriales bacterium]|nr:tetratricopeptide repeat protein [Flavobacteriales bacterium]